MPFPVFFSCGSNSGNGSVGWLVRVIVKKYSSFKDIIAQHGEMHKQLHNMVKCTNRHLHNMVKLPMNRMEQVQTCILMIAQHDEIHKLTPFIFTLCSDFCITWWNYLWTGWNKFKYVSKWLHNMLKFTNWPSIFSHCAMTLAQHGEITYKQDGTSSNMFLNNYTTWWNSQIDPPYFPTVQWHLHNMVKLPMNRMEQVQTCF